MQNEHRGQKRQGKWQGKWKSSSKNDVDNGLEVVWSIGKEKEKGNMELTLGQ